MKGFDITIPYIPIIIQKVIISKVYMVIYNRPFISSLQSVKRKKALKKANIAITQKVKIVVKLIIQVINILTGISNDNERKNKIEK